MALKAILENLDGLDPAIAAEYTEKDGKFFLDVTATGGYELSDTAGLKTALATERKAVKEGKVALKVFDGLDVEVAKAAITKLEELGDLSELTDLDKKLEVREAQLQTKFDLDRKKLVDKHTGEAEVSTTKIGTLTKQLHKQLIDTAATKAIADEKGSVELLLPVVRSSVKVVEADDGTMVAKVIGNDGEVRISTATGATVDMNISELVAELKGNNIYARAFDGSGASGAGSANSGTGPSGSNGVFQLSAADANDPRKYRAMKAEAAKAGRPMEIMDAV